MKSFLCQKVLTVPLIFFLQKNQSLLLFISCLYGFVRFRISDDGYEVFATNLSEDLFSSDDLKYTGLRYFHAILFLDFISLMILIESHASFS